MLPPIRAVAEGLAPAGEPAAWRLRAAVYLRDYARFHRQGLDTAGQTQARRALKELIEQTGADEAARAQLTQVPAGADEAAHAQLTQIPAEVVEHIRSLTPEEIESEVMVGMQVARAALEAERANLGAAIRWAAEAREGEFVHDLVDAIDSFLRTAGYWRDWSSTTACAGRCPPDR